MTAITPSSFGPCFAWALAALRDCDVDEARILHKRWLVKVLLFCVAILAVIAIAVAVRVIRSDVGMPALDDPKNVTPPPARDASKRRDERS